MKLSRGTVQIERAGQKRSAQVGATVQAGDVVTTGSDGSVGITFLDNSLLSAGPNSVLAIDRFAFEHGSDHWPLHQAGIPAVTVFSADYRAMNTAGDTLPRVDVGHLRELGKVVYRMVRGGP